MPSLEFTAKNTDGLGGAPSFDVAKSWPGIVFNQNGCVPVEAIEAVVHFEPITGNLDVRGHKFELLVFRETDYWQGRSNFTRVDLGRVQTEFEQKGQHYYPSKEVELGASGERNGNETTYRLRWKLEEDNPLTKTGRHVVVFLATHGETRFGAALLNYIEVPKDQGRILPTPIYSREGNGVSNPVDRKIAFNQEVGDIHLGFALKLGSVEAIYNLRIPYLKIVKRADGIALEYQAERGLGYGLDLSEDLITWRRVDKRIGNGSLVRLFRGTTGRTGFYRLSVEP